MFSVLRLIFMFCVFSLFCCVPVVLEFNVSNHTFTLYPPDEVFDDIVNTYSEQRCPSSKVLKVYEDCTVRGIKTECAKLYCCYGYVYIAGRCIPRHINPCSMNLCEQHCSMKGAMIWCNCYNGYKYNSENRRSGKQPYCEDINECEKENAVCEHLCQNTEGSYKCLCHNGYTLNTDGRTCTVDTIQLEETSVIEGPIMAATSPSYMMTVTKGSGRCYASCSHVNRVNDKIKAVTQQLENLEGTVDQLTSTGNIKFNSISPIVDGYCRCERGPRGPPGAPGPEGPTGPSGIRGPRGPKGDSTSLEYILILIADIKHDIKNIERKVYGDGYRPKRFDLEKAWQYYQRHKAAKKTTTAGYTVSTSGTEVPTSTHETSAPVYTSTSLSRHAGLHETSSNGLPTSTQDVTSQAYTSTSTASEDVEDVTFYDDKVTDASGKEDDDTSRSTVDPLNLINFKNGNYTLHEVLSKIAEYHVLTNTTDQDDDQEDTSTEEEFDDNIYN